MKPNDGGNNSESRKTRKSYYLRASSNRVSSHLNSWRRCCPPRGGILYWSCWVVGQSGRKFGAWHRYIKSFFVFFLFKTKVKCLSPTGSATFLPFPLPEAKHGDLL